MIVRVALVTTLITFTSSHVLPTQPDSVGADLLQFARFMIMPPDTITEKKVYEWKGCNPVPEIKSHKQYCEDIRSKTHRQDLDELFPGTYTGKDKKVYKNAADFVCDKLDNIISGDQTSLSPKEYSIFRHGPACPIGQKAWPYYHRLPYGPIAMGCKYLVMYWVFTEFKALYELRLLYNRMVKTHKQMLKAQKHHQKLTSKKQCK